MPLTKLFFATLLLSTLSSRPVLAQPISPDHQWEIKMAVTTSSNEMSTSVIAVHVPDKKEQVVFDEENGNGAGPSPRDLAKIRWTEDSRAFFIPANCALRSYDFSVCVLEKDQWNEVLREYTAPEVNILCDQVNGDKKHWIQEPIAWIRHNILKWTFSRGGNDEAIFFYRLTQGPKGTSLKFISGKVGMVK